MELPTPHKSVPPCRTYSMTLGLEGGFDQVGGPSIHVGMVVFTHDGAFSQMCVNHDELTAARGMLDRLGYMAEWMAN